MENNTNLDNLLKFTKAIELTNDIKCTIINAPNQYICYFLNTGDYNCFSKEARKILKSVNFLELKLDIEMAVMLHFIINPKQENLLSQVYDNKYWDTLYKNIDKIAINNYMDFINEFHDNFQFLIRKNRFSYNNIISIIINDFVELYQNNELLQKLWLSNKVIQNKMLEQEYESQRNIKKLVKKRLQKRKF